MNYQALPNFDIWQTLYPKAVEQRESDFWLTSIRFPIFPVVDDILVLGNDPEYPDKTFKYRVVRREISLEEKVEGSQYRIYVVFV